MIAALNVIEPEYRIGQPVNAIHPGQIDPAHVLYLSRERIRNFTYHGTGGMFSASQPGSEVTVIQTDEPGGPIVNNMLTHKKVYATEKFHSHLQHAPKTLVAQTLEDNGANLLECRFKPTGSGWTNGWLNLDHVKLKSLRSVFTLLSPPQTAVTLDNGSTLTVEMPCSEFRKIVKSRAHDPVPEMA